MSESSPPEWFSGAHPFGMDEFFENMAFRDPDTGDVVIDYVPNEKQYIAHNCGCDEVFYGGSLFGGKTYFLEMHNAIHCARWGQDAFTVIFRRTYDELQGTVIADHQQYFDGNLGTYNASSRTFHWQNGARTVFRHMQRKEDVAKHQGRHYTLVIFDELTQFLEYQYKKIFGWLRSPRNPEIQPRILSASNPRGVGHKWVYERFIKDVEPGTVRRIDPSETLAGLTDVPEWVDTDQETTRIFVPARMWDNKAGLQNDPKYISRVAAAYDEEEFQAFANGDWTFFEGLAFPEWDPSVHVIEPFDIPHGWKVIRSMDWGYGSPFSIGWWAQDPQSQRIYRINEWYGEGKKRNRGLKLSDKEIRQGILDREKAAKASGLCQEPWYGVADPSMWNRADEHSSHGEQINLPTPLFRAGNNDRLVGKQVLHRLLRVNPETGEPGLGIFNTCQRGFIDTIESLVLDDTMEDVDEDQEDHAYDEGRYGLVELVESPGRQTDFQEQEVVEQSRLMPAGI